MNSYRITLPGRSQTFAAGTRLSDALLDMGVRLKTPCGGKGTCGKCRVYVNGDEVLACRTFIDQDLNLKIGEEYAIESRPAVVIDHPCALAVDIGTTTVKISLVEQDGTSHPVDAFLNPQRRYGDDVISRIAAADEHDLTSLIRDQIKASIERLDLNIDCVTFSGNTTMLYLLFGLEVAPLGRSPFRAPQRDFHNLSLDIDAQILALPVLSAFVGGDLIGGLTLCHSRGFESGVFFVDLGTNGEMFLINPEGDIFATSCAMGPALEGMNISCGMTAEDGAITHVAKENGEFVYEQLGSNDPVGISGTALIDLIALLLDEGSLAANGRLPEDVPLKNGLTVTQKDIRSVQLAKGASLAAALKLLQESECRLDEIKHVFIAGAIGEHLNIENFRRLGFIPEFPAAEYSFIGNTSLQAAERSCMDAAFLARAHRLRDSVQEVALGSDLEFQQHYVDSMKFPERS